ncbi:MAG: hypothetical protein RIB63_01940, partial [Fulvivirga sp.]
MLYHQPQGNFIGIFYSAYKLRQIISNSFVQRKTAIAYQFCYRYSIIQFADAVAVTKLVSDGRLSLDKTIADYLPELVGRIENADKITLRL